MAGHWAWVNTAPKCRASVVVKPVPTICKKKGMFAIADANPFTKLTNAARALYNGQDPGSDLWQAIAWAVGITVVFAVLASRKFARSTAR